MISPASKDEALPTTYNGVISKYQALADSNDQMTMINMGLDQSGTYPIYRLEYGDTSKPKLVVINGTHQTPTEKPGVLTGLQFLRTLHYSEGLDLWLNAWLQNYCIIVIPSLNSWGYENNSYQNSRTVNLLTNFDYHWGTWSGGSYGDTNKGTAALSEAETTLLYNYLNPRKNSIIGLIDIHYASTRSRYYAETDYIHYTLPEHLSNEMRSVFQMVNSKVDNTYNGIKKYLWGGENESDGSLKSLGGNAATGDKYYSVITLKNTETDTIWPQAFYAKFSITGTDYNPNVYVYKATQSDLSDSVLIYPYTGTDGIDLTDAANTFNGFDFNSYFDDSKHVFIAPGDSIFLFFKTLNTPGSGETYWSINTQTATESWIKNSLNSGSSYTSYNRKPEAYINQSDHIINTIGFGAPYSSVGNWVLENCGVPGYVYETGGNYEPSYTSAITKITKEASFIIQLHLIRSMQFYGRL